MVYDDQLKVLTRKRGDFHRLHVSGPVTGLPEIRENNKWSCCGPSERCRLNCKSLMTSYPRRDVIFAPWESADDEDMSVFPVIFVYLVVQEEVGTIIGFHIITCILNICRPIYPHHPHHYWIHPLDRVIGLGCTSDNMPYTSQRSFLLDFELEYANVTIRTRT